SSKASISMVALSVSTSARTSPTATLSPSFLTQRSRVPSVIVSLSLGISIVIGMAGGGLGKTKNFFDDALRIRELAFLKGRAVDGRGVDRGYATDWCIKVVKSLFLNGGNQLSADAAKRFALFNDHRAMCFTNRIEDGFFIERPDGAKVNDLGANVMFRCQEFCRLETREDCTAVSD